MMFPYLDPTIVLLIPAVLFSLWAQFKVKGAFSRYSEVRASSGVTADQVSRELLDRFGLGNVRVERIQGHLTDHYDPRSKVLRLSDAVAGNSSIAAIGVAAHEVGHAIQDKGLCGILGFHTASFLYLLLFMLNYHIRKVRLKSKAGAGFVSKSRRTCTQQSCL